MEKQEWQGYVQKVASCDYPIPLNLINDYDDWKCRSNVGRMLMILKDIEGAMAVLATVKDVQPDMEDAPEFGLSEAEHKVLCLRDIAEIVWRLTGTGDAPIIYLNEAYRLCREYKKVFRSADRGAIWARRLELQRSCGAEDAALRREQCWRQKKLWKALIRTVSTHLNLLRKAWRGRAIMLRLRCFWQMRINHSL